METSKKSPKANEKASRDSDDKSDLYDQKMLKHRKDLGVRHFERYAHNDGEFRNEEKSCGIVDLDSGMNGTRARYGPTNRSIGAPSPAPPPVPVLQSYESPRGQPSTPQSQWKKHSPLGTDISTPSTHKSYSATTNSPSFSTPPMGSIRSFPTTPQGVSSSQRGLTSLNERMDLGPYIPKTPTPSRTIPNNTSEYRSNRGMTSSPSVPHSPPHPSTPQKNTSSYIAEHSRNDPSSSILQLNDASPDRLNGERNICIERSRGASNYTRRNKYSTEHSGEHSLASPQRNGPSIRNNIEEHSSPKTSRALTRNSPGIYHSSRFDHSAMKDVNSAQRHRGYEGKLDGRASISPDNSRYQRKRNRNFDSTLPVMSSNNAQGDDDEEICREFEIRVAAAAQRNHGNHNQSLPHVSCSLIQPQDSPQNLRRPSVTSSSQPHSLHHDPSRSLMRAALSANMHLRNLTIPSPGPFPTPQYIPPVPGSPAPLASPHAPHAHASHVSYVPQGGDDQAGPGKSVESSPPRGSVYRQSNKK